MGRTALLLNSLEEAQRAFEQAVSDDPQNVPAQIGLGSYHYTLAQLYFTRQQPMTTTVAMCANAFAAGQIDVNEIAANASKVPADFPQAQAALAQAQEQYRLALDLASQPDAPMPYLAHIARLMLASAYRLAGEGQIYRFDEQDAAGTPMPEWLDQASTQLAQADDLYRQTIDPLMEEQRFGLLAYAHYGLGLSQTRPGLCRPEAAVPVTRQDKPMRKPSTRSAHAPA